MTEVTYNDRLAQRSPRKKAVCRRCASCVTKRYIQGTAGLLPPRIENFSLEPRKGQRVWRSRLPDLDCTANTVSFCQLVDQFDLRTIFRAPVAHLTIAFPRAVYPTCQTQPNPRLLPHFMILVAMSCFEELMAMPPEPCSLTVCHACLCFFMVT